MEKQIMKVYRQPLLVASILLLILLSIAGYLASPVYTGFFMMFLFFAAAWIITHFRLQQIFMKTIAFLLPFSINVSLFGNSMIRLPTEPLLIVAFFLLVIDLVRKRPDILNDKVYRELLWIAPLVLAYIFTIPFSEMFMVSVKFTVINLLYIMVFYVYLAGIFRQFPELFIKMILLYGLGFLVVLIWGLFRFWQWEFNIVTIRGVFQPFYNDHTIFGATAAILACLYISIFKAGVNSLSRLLLVGLGIVFTGAVMLSTSRAAFLSLFVFTVIFIMLRLKVRIKHLVLIGMIAVFTFATLSRNITDRLQNEEALSYDRYSGLAGRTRSVGNITTDVSNIERMNRWISAWRMFKDRPLTGFGPGTYQFVYIPYQESSLENRLTVTNPWNVPEGSGGTAHSEYLLALSEMGVAGLAGWLILIGRWTFIAFNKTRRHPAETLITAAFAALATYIFHAGFNNFLNTDKFAFLFWGTAAWLIANYHSTRNEKHILQGD